MGWKGRRTKNYDWVGFCWLVTKRKVNRQRVFTLNPIFLLKRKSESRLSGLRLLLSFLVKAGIWKWKGLWTEAYPLLLWRIRTMLTWFRTDGRTMSDRIMDRLWYEARGNFEWVNYVQNPPRKEKEKCAHWIRRGLLSSVSPGTYITNFFRCRSRRDISI